MKKILILLIGTIIYANTFAQVSKEQLTYATEIFYTKVANLVNQKTYKQENFAELAFLKREYKLDSFKLDTKKYIHNLNDFYYKNFYLYSKLLDDNAIVTVDCINEDSIALIKKLLFYTLYPNSIKLPKNIVDQIEEQSTVHEFLGPYYSLINIYFLKKYNYNNLSSIQKDKLSKLELFLENLLYKKYVENNKSWDFYKFLSLKVLMMNNYKMAEPVAITDLATYIIADKDSKLALSASEKSNLDLMNKIGYYETLEYESNALLWIFLLELNKN